MDIPPPLAFKPMQAPELPSAAATPGSNNAATRPAAAPAGDQGKASRFNPFQGKKLSAMANNAGQAISNVGDKFSGAVSNVGKSIAGIFQR